jgi:hypothetical protein
LTPVRGLSGTMSFVYVKDRIMRRDRGFTRLVLDCSDFCFT